MIAQHTNPFQQKPTLKFMMACTVKNIKLKSFNMACTVKNLKLKSFNCLLKKNREIKNWYH